MSAWFKKKYPNKQTRLHLFCPPFLQNGHLIIYIFQGLVKISVTEDGVSRALPPSLLFSPGKSFDFILGNIFQTKSRFGWGFHKKKITFQTQSLAWRLRKKWKEEGVFTVLFYFMTCFRSKSLLHPHWTHFGFHRGVHTFIFVLEISTSGFQVSALDQSSSKRKHLLKSVQAWMSGLQVKCFAW